MGEPGGGPALWKREAVGVKLMKAGLVRCVCPDDGREAVRYADSDDGGERQRRQTPIMPSAPGVRARVARVVPILQFDDSTARLRQCNTSNASITRTLLAERAPR